MTGIALATEDYLSEIVCLRLLKELEGKLTPQLLLRKGGSGYLKSNIRKWCELSNTLPVLILTDLDNTKCPLLLIQSWLEKDKKPDNLLIRVAVREIESWLIADHEAIQDFLNSKERLSVKPDEIQDPKQYLLNLAKKAPRQIRDDLVQVNKGSIRQGLGYNNLLAKFVTETWDPERAAARSPSLAKARMRLSDLSSKL
ncbi:DUF4276 family protein [Pseudomonas sediminis]|uniref:DUF4276 family protein n=1 Tax=Pseudomonas sediminis TaxID=1691904 RepID=A0A2G5FHZ5_9PSED|nr:DUF4276 family protein [Pseudomonas sediminis]PIA67571.1 hypothetical protein CDO35_15230 [Pseudomonas sediminis]